MNIGYDFRLGGPKHAGLGRYAEELLLAMLEQDKDDHFFVIHNDSQERETLAKIDRHINTELVHVPARHYSLAEQVLLPLALRKLELDVILYPNFNHPIFDKTNFVVTIHDLVHHKISGHKKSRWLHFQAYKQIMKHAALKSKAIIAPSVAAKSDIASVYPTVEEKTAVIPEGISLKQQSDEFVKKVKHNFLLSRPYFLFVGTLERKKNTIGLARGFDTLIEKYKLDVDLVFAGKVDKHYPEIRQQTLDVKHKERIVFTGFVTDDELAALYQGAHCYVNASVNEGFGLPGVEAMQFGIPLAVSDTPVFNEVYDDAAVYFDPHSPDDIAEKLRLLATDKKFYETKQVAAANRSQFFSWDKAATETLALLKICAGKLKPKTIEVQNEFTTENA